MSSRTYVCYSVEDLENPTTDTNDEPQDCRSTTTPGAPPPPPPLLFPLWESPPENVPFRREQEVIVVTQYGQTFTIDESHPSIEGTRVLGYEGDLGHYGFIRAATPDEIAALEHREAENGRKDAITALRQHVQAQGVLPREAVDLSQGTVLLDSFDLFGGGERFVLTDDKLWYIQNHGRDDDSWEANNTRTQSAGALGWFLPLTADLTQQISRAFEDPHASK